MPKKYKVFIVTKHHEEKGVQLQTQWTTEARSRKEALESVLEEEGIIIEEKEEYANTELAKTSA